jgi:hypothetical protein
MLARLDHLRRRPEIDVGPLFSALCSQLALTSAVDPMRCRVQLDWIQYRRNFRPVVATRPFVGDPDQSGPQAEIAIDVRRLDDCNVDSDLESALRGLSGADRDGTTGWTFLEEPCPEAASMIWSFNRLYWEHLSLWEMTFQQEYASSLPGGESDGTNREFWRNRIGAFLDVLDDLARRDLLPDEIFVLELGVGSGQQARVWLDTFRAMDEARGRHFYPRIRYLMADYSADVLDTAREAAGEHKDQVSTLNLDALNVIESLCFLRYKVLFIHSCNLYDNLPTDEVALVDGELYRVRSRAAIRNTEIETICLEHGVAVEEFLPTLERVLRIGPELFDDVKAGVRFWSDVWRAVVLDEQYERIHAADIALVDDGSITVDDVIDVLPRSGRCQLSTGAIRSFANALPLLHPRGVLQVQDLFVTRPTDYTGAFRGPGKLDGSVINWLNGPLFAAVADGLGFHVEFEPFSRYREKSNTVVLTTVPKD